MTISVLPEDDAVELLSRGEMELEGRLVDASNTTLRAEISLDGLTRRCVYKPVRGERPLWDFPDGTLCNREVASYEVSRALGWDIVPVTVLRTEGPLGPGALQRFVDHDPEEHYFTLLPGHPVHVDADRPGHLVAELDQGLAAEHTAVVVDLQ